MFVVLFTITAKNLLAIKALLIDYPALVTKELASEPMKSWAGVLKAEKDNNKKILTILIAGAFFCGFISIL